MKRVIFLLVIAIGALTNVYAQIEVSKVQAFVTQSPDEYKVLVDRFVKADTTLTLDELSMIYYGAPFCKDFTFGKYDAQLDELYNNASSVEQYDVVGLVAQRALNENPTSFDLLVKAIVGVKNGSDKTAQEQLDNLRTRYTMIFKAISASGSGVTPEAPCYVTSQNDKLKYLSHAYGVVEVLEECEISNCVAVKVNYLSGEEMKEAIIYVKMVK